MIPFYSNNESTPDPFNQWWEDERGSSEFEIEDDADDMLEDSYEDENE